MITAVKIAYRLPGDEHDSSYVHEVSARSASEAVAFDEAVEELKVDLLMDYSHWHDLEARRALMRAVLQLKPWAQTYNFS